MRTGELGFWWRSVGGPPLARAPLPGPLRGRRGDRRRRLHGPVDAPTTSARADPPLRVVVLEARVRRLRRLGAQRRLGVGLLLGTAARAYERPRGPCAPRGAAAGDVRDGRRDRDASLERHGDRRRPGSRAGTCRWRSARRSWSACASEVGRSARRAASARRTCALLDREELAQRVSVAGALGGELLAARRAGAPGQARRRPRPRGGGARRGDLRAHPGQRDRARTRR